MTLALWAKCFSTKMWVNRPWSLEAPLSSSDWQAPSSLSAKMPSSLQHDSVWHPELWLLEWPGRGTSLRGCETSSPAGQHNIPRAILCVYSRTCRRDQGGKLREWTLPWTLGAFSWQGRTWKDRCLGAILGRSHSWQSPRWWTRRSWHWMWRMRCSLKKEKLANLAQRRTHGLHGGTLLKMTR